MTRARPVVLALVVAAACASNAGAKPGTSRDSVRPARERGLASYYADALHGRPTASGEPYDRKAATCAHRTHPFGTRLSVTLREGGRKVVCRVNDRGPFVKGRVVDLSRRLAQELGIIERGIAEVMVHPID